MTAALNTVGVSFYQQDSNTPGYLGPALLMLVVVQLEHSKANLDILNLA